MSFEDVIASTAAATGLAAAGFQIVSWLRNVATTQDAQEKASAVRRDKALSSDDLAGLGNYLFNDIGSIRVSDYQRNSGLRVKVDTALNSVLEYLGRDAVLPEELPVPEVELGTAQVAASAEARLAKARSELSEGAIWDSLAIIRREIERALRDELQRRKPGAAQVRGATALLRDLERAVPLPPSVVHHLSYAIQVANAGVHGRDVSYAAADEALQSAILGLSELESGHYEPPRV